MKAFIEKSIKQEDEFQVEFMKGINKLWDKLRQDNVHQQGFVLKTKK